MTPQELLQLDSNQLASLSDEDIKKIYKDYLPAVRKSLDPRTIRAAKMLLEEDESTEKAEKLKKAMEYLKSKGH